MKVLRFVNTFLQAHIVIYNVEIIQFGMKLIKWELSCIFTLRTGKNELRLQQHSAGQTRSPHCFQCFLLYSARKLRAGGTINESKTCFVWIPLGSRHAFMSTFFIGVLGCKGVTAHFGVKKALLGSPPHHHLHPQHKQQQWKGGNLTRRRQVF